MSANMDNQEINSNTSPVSSSNKLSGWLRAKFQQRQRLAILVIAVLVILLAIAGLYAWDRWRSNEPPIDPNRYSLDEQSSPKNMPTYNLQGTRPGTGLKFIKPFEFIHFDTPFHEVDKKGLTTKADNVELGQRAHTSAEAPAVQSGIAVRIAEPSENTSPVDQEYVQKTLAKMFFQSEQFPSRVKVDLYIPTQFTNEKIKNNATAYDISASYAPNTTRHGPIRNVAGQLVHIRTEKATYYFIVAASEENWVSSPKSWQAIKDSLEITQ